MQDLYRFVDDRGHVSGERIHYRRVPPVNRLESGAGRQGETDDDFVGSLRGTCSRLSTAASVNTCRADFTRPLDWAAVLNRAEAAGLWTLPDQSIRPDGLQVLDGWGIVVELRDGSHYRAYNYNNPDLRGLSAENASAVAIRTALAAIDSLRK